MNAENEKRMRSNTLKRMNDLPQAVQEFIQFQYNQRSVATVYEYAKDMDLFIKFLKSHYSLDEISNELVMNVPLEVYKSFIRHIEKHKVTFVTPAENVVTQSFTNSTVGVNRKIATLLVWTAYLEQNDYTEQSINKMLTINNENKDENEIFFTSKKTARKLLKTIEDGDGIISWQAKQYHEKNKERDLAIIQLMLFSGLKVSEIINLNRHDIDLSHQIIFVNRKKGRERQIVIPNESVSFIREHLEKVSENDITEKNHKILESQFPLFMSLHNESINQKTITNLINKYILRANIKETVTPQTLRRTCEVMLLEAFKNKNAVNWAVGRKYTEIRDEYKFREIWRYIACR